jgi:hypothetical protein
MNIANKIQNKKNSNQTVFTITEIMQITGVNDTLTLNSSLGYAVDKEYIYRITRGIYSLKKEYSKEEFANKYRKPSYISLYTVLQKAGIVFQPYTSVYAITNRTEEIEVDSQKYIYRKIKDEILLNNFGINIENGVMIASPERAICDKLYLDGNEYFDNLRNIDWELMEKLNNEVYMNNQIINNFIQTYTFNG